VIKDLSDDFKQSRWRDSSSSCQSIAEADDDRGKPVHRDAGSYNYVQCTECRE